MDESVFSLEKCFVNFIYIHNFSQIPFSILSKFKQIGQILG